MTKLILCFLLSLFVGVAIGFPVLQMCKKLKISQNILHYVDKHSSKQGTPTMGGIIFILAIILVSGFFIEDNVYECIMVLINLLAFGLIGFLDDFLKIRHHQNEGLTAKQKMLALLAISVINAFFCVL